ncbi:unnamed protein product [Dovyalis caffra]|uniref:F-box domain-containing protein n=1 Tax=Dovyalis caffra TaxID=77055 RepID=A0AAV1SPU1_9ROSI|nr:unnamed protein product [Dovyalis caffra]
MNNSRYYGWADLPKELLEMISKRLDSRIDLYRFRAVCTSWRSTISVFYKQFPRVPHKLPKPIWAHAYLSQVTICRVEFVEDSEDPSASSSMAWLAKVEESTHGEIQLLVPVSNRQLSNNIPGMVVKMLNLLNFRLVELTRAYSLKLARGSSVYGINKVVLFPPSTDSSTNEYGVLAIFHEGKLAFWRVDDDKWKLLDERNFHYDDIMVYKGQYYVVDRWGTVSWIDSSLNVVQYSPPLYGCGHQKSLVESGGDLFIVDRYFDYERRTWNNEYRYQNVDLEHRVRNLPICRAQTVRIRVYKLDEEWGTWVNISSLGDEVFVLGNECSFSVSAKEFSGCEGNCIYFIDPFDAGRHGELSGCDARVYNLSSGSIGKVPNFPGNSCIFCPPPTKKVLDQISVVPTCKYNIST